MIKSRLSKIFVASMAFSSIAMAGMVDSSDYSLIGIEGGFTSIKYDISNKRDTARKNVGNVGMKIGSETDNYRIFLATNYYTKPNSSYDYIGTYGGEFDYLLNISSKVNFYLGANAGMAKIKFTAANENRKRILSHSYYGGDTGFTFHASKLIDLELGARLMILNASNRKNSVTYTFDNFITGYASLIFKYHTD